MLSSRCFVALAVAAFATFSVTAQETKLKYPETKKGEVVDDYHGTKVADPYRWLEDDVRKSKDVADWVEAENKVTDRATSKRSPSARRSRSASPTCGTTRSSPPRSRTAAATSSRKNDGLQNQTVLYVQDTLDGEAAAAARPEHVVARTAPSPWPGCRSATTASTSPTASPRPAPTGTPGTSSTSPPARPLADELKWIKFSGASWTHGRQGLLLQPLPRAEDGRRRSRASNVNQKLYYHRLGTPQTDDVLVYERPDQPDVGLRRRRHRGRPLPRHHHRRRHRRAASPHRLQGPGRAARACRST